MKKLNLIYLRSFKIFLATLGLLLGFSFKVAAQYGIVEEEYKVKGAVLSEDCDFKIPKVKLSLKDNDKTYNISDFTKFSDSDGFYNFTLMKGMLDDNIEIIAEDIDSTDNMGLFKKTTYKLHIDKTLFKLVDKSEWHRYFEYPNEIMIFMKSIGEAPCDESKRRKKQ